MPARKGKQHEETFRLTLTAKQRESLIHATQLTAALKKRIQEAPNDQQFAEFTKKELKEIEDEISTLLTFAPPAHQKRLFAVLKKVGNLLGKLEEKSLEVKRRAVAKAGAIYQFKVTLKESAPPIWRRIQVPDCTLGEFHEVLQVVMGWEHSHLHQFIVAGEYYGPSDPEDLEWGMETQDEEEISLSQVANTGRKVRFTYEYDFGDSWQHEIVLEKTLEPEPNVAFPRCVDGARACPPEDVGGIWGYVDFLEAIRDRKHDSHDDMVSWIGGKFDPEKFSVAKVNRDLGLHFSAR
jgi:Plasmid pRiA4b ORF-3-like protein